MLIDLYTKHQSIKNLYTASFRKCYRYPCYTFITWFGAIYAFYKPIHSLFSVNCPKPG